MTMPPNLKLQNQMLMMAGWRQQKRWPVMLAMVLVLAGLGYYFWQQKNLSGVYMSQTPRAVRVLQLVQGSGGRLNGEYASVKIDDAGKIQETSASLEGKTDGTNISLSVKSAEAPPVQFKIIGTRGWKNLTLSINVLGEPVETSIYLPSDLAAFQFNVDALKRRAANMPAERKALEREDMFVKRINAFIERLKFSNKSIDDAARKFSPTAQDYHRITGLLSTSYQKAQNMSGDSYAPLRRQIVANMTQDSSAMTTIHAEVKKFQADFEAKLQPLAQEIYADGEACGHYRSDAAVMACSSLRSVGSVFGQRRDKMMKTLGDLEVSYQSELQQQQGFIARAEQLK